MLFYCVKCRGLSEEIGAVADGAICCKTCYNRLKVEYRPLAERVRSHPAFQADPVGAMALAMTLLRADDGRSNEEIVEITIALFDEAVLNGRF